MDPLSLRAFLPTVALALLLAAPSWANNLRVFVTEDPAVADEEPLGDGTDGWVETDADNEVPVNLAPGDVLYVSVLNDEDLARRKFWVIRLEGPLSQRFSFTVPAKDAYDGFQTANDAAPVPAKGLQSVNIAPIRQWTLWFSPQPRWERLALEAFPNAVGQLKITSNSICLNQTIGPEDIILEEVSLDSPRGVAGEPLYTEFWVFPRDVAADADVPPIIEAPPHTGVWASEFVGADPEGNARPTGVRFSTPGPGLTPLDRFDAGFSMVGRSDVRYDVFYLDSVSGSYASLTIGAQIAAPAVPLWALAVAVLALAAATWVVVRGRVGGT